MRIKRFNENTDSEKGIQNYMFFSNLKTIKRLVDDMLKMDESEIDEMLSNGHNWASDHIATSKDDIEEVYNFIKGDVSESIKYHLDNNKPITENIFRPGSESFYGVLKEARKLFDVNKINLCDSDKELYESTDIGRFAMFNGELVPLDIPMESIIEINEAEYQGKEVKLNHPMRGGSKKYHVYVKNPKTGNVKKIAFGDTQGGLTAKVSNPEARKSFAARHKCDTKKDKTKAGYWVCRLTKYGHLFGGKTYPGYW